MKIRITIRKYFNIRTEGRCQVLLVEENMEQLKILKIELTIQNILPTIT